MTRKLWIIAGLALLMTSCTRTRTPGAQGQTHWWKSCDTNADCGDQADLSCICSVCMAQCSQSGNSCEVEGRAAECFGPNAEAVQTLCGGAAAPAAAAVCLEPCESECGDGFRCEDGACIAIEPQPMAGRGAAGSGAAGSGAAGTGEQDGGPAQPMATPLAIELVNETNAPVYAQTHDCTANPSWFRIGVDDTTIIHALYCAADCATNPTGPQGCPAICLAPKFQMLEPGGGAIRFEWDGMEWIHTMLPGGCANHAAVARGKAIAVTFCWMTRMPTELVPGFPEQPSPDDLTCETVTSSVGAEPVLRFTIE